MNARHVVEIPNGPGGISVYAPPFGTNIHLEQGGESLFLSLEELLTLSQFLKDAHAEIVRRQEAQG